MSFTILRRILTGHHARMTRGARRPTRGTLRGLGTTLELMETRLLPTITVALDFSLDVHGFFNNQARRDIMKFAADTLATSLTDSLAAIAPNAAAGNNWTADFPDPSNGTLRSLSNLSVPANTLIIYVGGGTLAGASEAGQGSTGGFSGSGSNAWLDILSARGKAGALATPPTSFGPWGGSIEFDDTGGTNWYFGQSLIGLGSNQTDFLSVAEHEIGHVLGLGTAGSWDSRVSGGFFDGPTTRAVNGNAAVAVNATGDHWADAVRSNGGPALMDAVLTNGTRSLATSLDIAALRDIGWQVNLLSSPTVQFSAPTYSVNETGGSLFVTVTRSGGMPSAFSVTYATSNGTAKAGQDYQATNGVLSFANGELVKTFSIPIVNDNLADGNETVNLTLSAPTSGALLASPSTSTITIIDASPAPPPPGSVPVGDFDADGRTDFTVFRPSAAAWLIQQSTAGLLNPSIFFGASSLFDIPVVGDFEGVGHAEVAVFRPSTAQWFVLGPTGGHLLGVFGATNLFDIPVPGDYDGVGHAELAVFRPSTAQWFVLGPTGGRLLGTFGATNLNDIPAPGNYDGTGKTEMAVFRPATAQWFVNSPGGGRFLTVFGGSNFLDIPVPGDYDGTGRTEVAVYRPSTGQWFSLAPSGGRLAGTFGLTNYVDVPAEASVGSLVRLGVMTRHSVSALGKPSMPTPVTEPLVIIGPSVLSTSAKRKSRDSTSSDVWITAIEQLMAGS